MKHFILAAAIVAGCASYNGAGLVPQKDTLNDVLRTMGEPAMRWNNPDGSSQLSYPRGPAGPESYMVMIGPDGKLQGIKNVLNDQTFAQIRPGMTKEQVLRLIGPPNPHRTTYDSRRDELAWGWTYQFMDDPAQFVVLFDAGKGVVRTTQLVVESTKIGGSPQ